MSTKPESNAERKHVYEVAAQVFHRQGYDNTSMRDVAEAAGLTKAGLYHHISSKESLLYIVLAYGLDLTEARVVQKLHGIADPLERLEKLIELHLRLVLEERNPEVTGLLHECRTLSNSDRTRINRRKKAYVQLTTTLIDDVLRAHHVKSVEPKLAAFALLGMLNWTYQWYKPSGDFDTNDVINAFRRIFVNGILCVAPKKRIVKRG